MNEKCWQDLMILRRGLLVLVLIISTPSCLHLVFEYRYGSPSRRGSSGLQNYYSNENFIQSKIFFRKQILYSLFHSEIHPLSPTMNALFKVFAAIFVAAQNVEASAEGAAAGEESILSMLHDRVSG